MSAACKLITQKSNASGEQMQFEIKYTVAFSLAPHKKLST